MSESLQRQSTFTTFDGQFSVQAAHQRPDRYSHLEQASPDVFCIARGRGYSYSAASFGKDSLVQDMSLFNRFLHFDEQASTVTVEPGVTLQALLAWAMPRELYFPVMPGYPLITLGGCVAADAHGKNPAKDGTTRDWIQALTVFHPAKGYQECSPQLNTQLFDLTCGGFGLTGIITSITLKLLPLPSTQLVMRQTPVASLSAAVELLASDDSEVLYSWHDLCFGLGFGRGIVHSGEWCQGPLAAGEKTGQTEIPRYPQMTAQSRAKLPVSLWNRLSARMANSLLLALSKRKSPEDRVSLFSASFPFAGNPYFHRFFGSKGLREVQILVPKAGVTSFLSALELLIQTTRAPTMMGSIKAFRGSAEALSLNGEGYLVTVVCYAAKNLKAFLDSLDQLTIEHAGQPNLTKDSRVPQSIAEVTLPHFESFKERLVAYDPPRLMRSELSARLGLL
ncbi:MAG: FAD-binding oxidoreductase [Pseudomonadales bacterium]